MTLTITVTGGETLARQISMLGRDIQEAANKAVVGTAHELRGDIIKAFQSGPASGRIYENYNPRRTHQASAPGQAPMSDTGRLASSVFVEQDDLLTASVGSMLTYALYLEMGTTRMAPRPAWEPAAMEIAPKFEERLKTGDQWGIKMNSANLHRALYTRLSGFAGISGVVTGVYSKVPQPDSPEDVAGFPYITLGPHNRRPFDTDDDDGQEVSVNVHIWDRYTSELTRGALRDAVYDALHKYDLPITSADTLDCLFVNGDGFEDPDGKTFHTIIQFRVTYTGI